jgi:hypothetical protein
LRGEYRQLSTSLYLDPSTPHGLEVRVAFTADGNNLGSFTLHTDGDAIPVEISIDGARELALEAQAVDGTCMASPIGYGIAFDAHVA